MNNDTRGGIRPLVLVLIVLNIVMVALITTSWLKSRKSASEEYDTVTDSSTSTFVSDTSFSVLEITPQLPDIDESEFVEEEEYFDEENFSDNSEEAITTQTPRVYDEVQKDAEGRRPDYYDFDWYLSEVNSWGIPDGAMPIYDLGEILGEWKAYIHYDPENITGNPCDMRFNLDISPSQDGVTVLFDWYYVKYVQDDSPEYETSTTTYTGSWDGNKLHAKSKGSLEIDQFYELNGKQYAIGTITDHKNVPAVIALVRDKE